MIRGTSLEQDSRFKDKSKKMLQESTWPEKFDNKIMLSKINFDFLKLWVDKRVTQLLGYQDDVVSGTAMSLIEQYLQKQEPANAKKIHVALSGFLTDNTVVFVSELWDYLQSANKNDKNGIGTAFVQEHIRRENQEQMKLRELEDKKRKIKNYRANDVIKRYAHRDRDRERDQNRERDSERGSNRDRRRSASLEKHRYKRRDRSRSRSRQRRRSKDYGRQKQHKRRDRSRQKPKKQHKAKHRRYHSESSQEKDRRYRQTQQKDKRIKQKIKESPIHEKKQNGQKQHKEKRSKIYEKHEKQISKRKRKQRRQQKYSESQSSSVISSSSSSQN